MASSVARKVEILEQWMLLYCAQFYFNGRARVVNENICPVSFSTSI